ncbi:MAG: hypothetical protein LN413_01835 [Candidatus Thermoplasmatota archaeon]|nr:hypothetical protein [Candidatus Thermoplasmatota archaeon]
MALVDPLVAVVVGVVLLVAGLVLAAFGAGLVRVFMAVLGAIIGGTFGFLGGSLLGVPIFPVIFGIVGVIVGVVLFGFVVRAAISLAAGIVVGSVTYLLLGGSTEPGAMIPAETLVFAFIGFLVGAVLIYVFFNRLLGVITALVGGLLVGISLNFLTINLAGLSADIALAIGLVGGGVVFLAGAIRQSRASD